MLYKRKEFYLAFFILQIISIIQIYLIVQRQKQLLLFSWNAINFTYSAEQLLLFINDDTAFVGVFIFVFPILCSMAFSGLSLEESANNMGSLFIGRRNEKKDLLAKFFLSFASAYILTAFTLLINYLVLLFLFGSGPYGNIIPGNLLSIQPVGFFCDQLFIKNSISYAFVCIHHLSTLIGLIATLSFSVSLFINHKLLNYFSSAIVLIVSMVIGKVFSIEALSLSQQLQVISSFTVRDAICLYIIMLIIDAALIMIHIKRGKYEL